MAERKPKAPVEPPKPLASDLACTRCPLHETSGVVCCESVGPMASPLMLVGEALGAAEEQLGRPFCLVPETLVLMADCSWRPLSEVAVGDKVIGLDEEGPVMGDGVSGSGVRCWRVATVLRVHVSDGECHTVKTHDGLELTGTADHRVLTETRSWWNGGGLKRRQWCELGKLMVRDTRPSSLVSVGAPWKFDGSWDAGWLAGFLDGEGHVVGSRTPAHDRRGKNRHHGLGNIGFSQNESDSLARAIDVLELLGFELRATDKQDNAERTATCYRVHVRGGVKSSLRLLGTVRPHRLLANFQQVLNAHNVGARRLESSIVVERERAGRRRVIDITTTCGTFIANGVVVHNCGDAGQKLNYCLNRAGIARKQTRIANSVRCRPPANKTPSKKHLDACWPYLLWDILKQRPKVIVALGATAYAQLNRGAGTARRRLDKWRGFPQRVTYTYTSAARGKTWTHTCWLVPTYHPAAALRHWEYDDLIIHDLKLAAAYAAGNEELKEPDTKVIVARTYEQALDLLRRLRTQGSFVLDVETAGKEPGTDGLNPHKSNVLCVGFCWHAGEAHVLPLRRQGGLPYWTAAQHVEIERGLADVLEDARVCGQNVKFDLKHLRAFCGARDVEIEFDTLAAHHCIDENKPHNLTFLCQWYLRWTKYDAVMESFARGSSDDERSVNYASAPDETLWLYNGRDCDGTFRLRGVLEPLVESERVQRALAVELALCQALVDVEFRGIHILSDRIKELGAQFRKKREKTLARLRLAAGQVLGPKFAETFNPQSPQQLIKLLKAAGADMTRKTKSGAASADKLVMGKLALRSSTKPGRIAARVQELRKLTKYVSTYLDGPTGESGGFLPYVHEERVHPTFNVSVARTGRLSATDPPVQTIPKTDGLRTMFVPDVVGRDVLLSADYDRVELCVVAWLANDKVMVRELLSGIDLHTRMAVTARLMRDPTDEEFERMKGSIEPLERSVAKSVNFGIIYGRGAHSIVEANPGSFPESMPKLQRIRRVQRVLDAYWAKYQGVERFMQRQVERGEKQHYVRSYVYGRKRRVQGLDWFDSKWAGKTEHYDHDRAHVLRELQNYEVQETASDTLSSATARCYQGIKGAGLRNFRIVLTLHDQLLFNCHAEDAERAKHLIRGWMETELPQDERHKFGMPLKVSIDVQRCWGVSVTGEQEY